MPACGHTHEKQPLPDERVLSACAWVPLQRSKCYLTQSGVQAGGSWSRARLELTRPAEAAGAAAAEDSAQPAHLFAYPLESNFSGVRCAPVLALTLSLWIIPGALLLRRCIGSVMPHSMLTFHSA